MILHLFYKEWLKTRWFLFFVVLLGLAIVTYIFLDVDNNVRMKGSFNYLMNVFYGIPQANYYHSLIKYVPLLMGVCVGLSQYVPEVIDKRIKLTLHLPMHNTVTLYMMLCFGFLMLLASYAVVFGTFFYLNNLYFPFEESWAVLTSLMPWLLGGVAVYFMIAMISMEPNLFYQFLYGIVAFFLVKQFYIGVEHADTRHIIPALAIMAFVPCTALLYTSYRFIKGER